MLHRGNYESWFAACQCQQGWLFRLDVIPADFSASTPGGGDPVVDRHRVNGQRGGPG